MFLRDLIVKTPTFYHWSQQFLSLNKFALKRIVRRELAGLPKLSKVLDLGCGTGILSTLFDAAVYQGVDVDPDYIKKARRTYYKNFSVMSGEKLDFSDRVFDLVLLSCTLHHTDDTTFKKILLEVRRVLKKPDGRCLLIDNIQPLGNSTLSKLYASLDEGGHIRRLESYRKLVAEQADVCKEYVARDYPFGFLFFIPVDLCVFLIA